MKNVEFLRDQIKYTGYGEGYETQLKEKINKGLPEFQLNHRTEFNGETVTAVLDFSKSKNSDMYFFNSHTVEFKPEGSKELMSQTFRMGKENNITLKEAFNMMDGRAIYKEFTKLEKQGEGKEAKFVPTDEKYMAWKQFNFKETDKFGNFKTELFTDAYGFDLKAELSRLPLKDLDNEQTMSRIVSSLQKGNRQLVQGTEGEIYLVANPQFKRVETYDMDLNKLQLREEKSEKQSNSQDTSKVEGEKKLNRKNSKKTGQVV